MKLWHKAVGGFGLLAAVATGATLMMPAKHKPLHADVSVQSWPSGPPGAGDVDGKMCHSWKVCGPRNEGCKTFSAHDIPGLDFRSMSPDERERATEAHLRKDADETDISCGGPAFGEPFLGSPAYAQPHCPPDGCGGGCETVNCPATAHAGDGCTLVGTTCVSSITCCPGPCLCE